MWPKSQILNIFQGFQKSAGTADHLCGLHSPATLSSCLQLFPLPPPAAALRPSHLSFWTKTTKFSTNMNLSRRYHLNIKLSTFIGPSLKIQLPFLVQQNLELQLPSELLQTYFYSLPFLVQTSQELRMLFNVTLNCQVAKIVMNSGSQLSEL